MVVVPHRRKRTAVLVAGSLVVVILAAAVSTIGLASGKTARGGPAAVTGSVRLERRHVEGGRTIRGEVVFENHGSRPEVLMRGCKIDGLFAIGLRASDGYLQPPAFSLVGCAPEQAIVAEPGISAYRFTTPATYAECSQRVERGPPAGSKGWIPLCLENSDGDRDIMPRLPAGRYTAVFFPDGEWHGPHVRSAELVITRGK